jgi:hypothetical protein
LSTALALFDQLCAVGNALVLLQGKEEPCSDRWCDLTCLILQLDATIDLLVRSSGLTCDNAEEDPPCP